MKSVARSVLLQLAAFLLWAPGVAQAQGPAAPGGGSVPLIIRKITPGRVETPEYQLKKSQFAARTRTWFQLIVDYDTAPEWIDEAVFTYYVAVKARKPEPGKNPITVFKGEVSYINIERGKHKSDIYLHPSTVSRFGDVERVAVEVRVGGAVVAREGQPAGSAAGRWWESFAPLDGYLLNRMQTPFAMINFDDYEAVRAGRN